MKRLISILLMSLVLTATAQVPALQKVGSSTCLMVDGKPFVMYCGELHNSTASSMSYMQENKIWDKLQAMHLNSVIATVSWELVEPQEGKFDFTLVDDMIAEAKTMKAEFVLADLPTFAGVNDVLIEYDIKESPAQVRSRLGKMFTEAVKKGNAKGIERAVIERNGVEEFKSASRAAVYCNKLYKQKKNSK